MKNHLVNETSPYLLQHADQPVDWYPWCEETFQKAKTLDKPVFLSIGYSACHWCHVMAEESFADEEVAKALNEGFVSIKVDREERPDIDSVYMAVCQAFTGSGGWPMTIFMTPDQEPFYAGTYFPKYPSNRGIGFLSLAELIAEKWQTDREELLETADEVVKSLNAGVETKEKASQEIAQTALKGFRSVFDRHFGGFGREPKFPTPHNLLFLLDFYKRTGDQDALNMAETTLTAMYRGGLFDHIGYGFSRYSTDRYFLIPHFEKMLYDNGLLIAAYASAYDATKKELYLQIAQAAAGFILREMTGSQGGFYSAQDADSEGVEGKFYALSYDEALEVLGEERGRAFNAHFGITRKGNFEGKSIPNLLNTEDLAMEPFAKDVEKMYQYRRRRARLHRDDKVLAAWNGLMIWALCVLYRVSGHEKYLQAALRAERFLEEHLYENGRLFVSYRDGKRSKEGFLDDYAYVAHGLIALYEATLDTDYLNRGADLCLKAMEEFADEDGGYFLSGKGGEKLISRPKETYDGAMPSGNSVMAMNFAKLAHLTGKEIFKREAKGQIDFLYPFAKAYPLGYSFYLLALLSFERPMKKLVCVLKNREDAKLLRQIPDLDVAICIMEREEDGYSLLEGETAYYFCDEKGCRPPTGDFSQVLAWLS